MKRTIAILCLLLVSRVAFAQQVSIFPAPVSMECRSGYFVFDGSNAFELHPDNTQMREAVEVFAERFGRSSGMDIQVAAKGDIVCFLSEKVDNPEGYELTVTPKKIRITASTPAGVFYALQSVRQLLPPQVESAEVAEGVAWRIPCVVVKDAPRFAYRGAMFDVCRNFFDKEFILQYIDILALHKINRFHWHLTDDQGWRIEIDRYPKLTSVGAFRDRTMLTQTVVKPRVWDNTPVGGFFTRNDVREVVEFARKRNIEVIPEIEMPGHALAALSAYPQYSCTGGPFEVDGKWGVFNDIFCPKEETFAFLQNILDEVVELFPSRYVHIGGDEAPKVRWKRCHHCQELMEREGLENETELQAWFTNRMETYLRQKGKTVIGWDEILDGDINRSAVVMSWRGYEGGMKAAKRGHDVIMCPNKYLYFDYYQFDNDRGPLEKRHRIPLEKVYCFNPVPEGLDAAEQSHIMGVQANMWTEYVRTPEYAQYLLFPRLTAYSEMAWGTNGDYGAFLERLKDFEKRYEVIGINYAK